MNSKKKTEQIEHLTTINNLTREFSTVTVLMHQAIAQKAGLVGTDHKYIDLLLQHGSMTAGQLAELSGITTGAVTAMIDRLEKSKLVKRERQTDDRRKVLVVLDQEEAFKRIGPAFMTMQEDLKQLYNDFTETELATVEKYLKAAIEFSNKQIRNLNEN
ncbi:MarR family winged helix-turn-helix transcriptional regulator [Chryseobacterium geocarposphaerae]|uniref:DNA-binding MarR family transcriptional regulator n=1 Tax=Chryseobacterium geocarposphaerae TaxID=1416776 RepID=A0A2M9C6U7_9FLAO|nr:MarR family transcriptional regulator [Chryseobacterium geocarposphaerae]PJJ66548.1 DNA-binding MarR family transcriptional regulator [Chryseobacterium geocarposphaerae]